MQNLFKITKKNFKKQIQFIVAFIVRYLKRERDQTPIIQEPVVV